MDLSNLSAKEPVKPILNPKKTYILLIGTVFYLPTSYQQSCSAVKIEDLWGSPSLKASPPSTAAEAVLLPLREPSVYIKLYPRICSTISLCAAW